MAKTSDRPKPTEGATTQNGSGSLLTNTVHYIKDLSFENVGIVKNLLQQLPAPEISINIQVEVKKMGDHLFEVLLVTEAKALQDKATLFLVQLTYGGLFSVESSVPEEQRKPLLLINAPALLFPFCRRVVASTIQDGALPPLLLNTIDFASLYEQQEKTTSN